jgi:hypothetical protein
MIRASRVPSSQPYPTGLGKVRARLIDGPDLRIGPKCGVDNAM